MKQTNFTIKSFLSMCCLLTFMLGFSHMLAAQDFTHPVTGTTNFDVICDVTHNYYDNGGILCNGEGGPYANNSDGIGIFCPTTAGAIVTIEFLDVDIETRTSPVCWDFLNIYDGSGTGGTQLFQGCGEDGFQTCATLAGDNSDGGGIEGGVNDINGTNDPPAPANNIWTSGDPSGCLTVHFTSDGSVPQGGWVAEVTTTNCANPSFTHPTTGIENFDVDCGVTYDYFDSGGADCDPAGEYSSNEDGVSVFCAGLGSTLTIEFLDVDLETRSTSPCWDFLNVYDGDNTAATQLFSGCGEEGFAACPGNPGDGGDGGNIEGGPNDIDGTNATTPVNNVFTSTNALGCITVEFDSDGSGQEGGWVANITAVNCPIFPTEPVLSRECFDDCVMPDGWTVSHTGGATGVGTCGDGVNVFSFDGCQDFASSSTPPAGFDGCYAAIDDDNPGSGVVGVGCIITDVLDVSSHANVTVQYDWQHEAGGGIFTVDVWDGAAWQNIQTETVDGSDHAAINVDAHTNAAFQTRFCYDDEGGFNWGSAIDNYEVRGDFAVPALSPVFFEDFDGPGSPGLPAGWSLSSTTGNTASSTGCYAFGNGNAGIPFFFGCTQYQQIGCTPPNFTGFCAAIDADAAFDGGMSVGKGCIESPVIDTDGYLALNLAFDFEHQTNGGSGNNNTQVEVWDGADWIEVFNVPQDLCGSADVDISQYANAAFQTRFCYNVNTSTFAWGAAWDNIDITGVPPQDCAGTFCRRDAEVLLDNSGSATLAPSDVYDDVQNCFHFTPAALSQTAFTCADVTNVTVTLTASDDCGSTHACTADVAVRVATPPTAVCMPTTITVNTLGVASINPADVDGGSSDVCGAFTLSVSPNSFTCEAVGPNTVTLTVTSTTQQTGTCEATVTVVDDRPTPPNDICPDFEITGVLGTNTTNYDDPGVDGLALSGQQMGRLNRNGVASTCANKACTGVFNATTTYGFDAYYFQNLNPFDVCYTINYSAGDCGTNAHPVIYESCFYDPFNGGICNESPTTGLDTFVGDIGSSASGAFSFTISAGATFYVVVTNTATQTPCNYSFNISEATPPTMSCVAPFAVDLDPSGNVCIYTSDVDDGSSDNCGGLGFEILGGQAKAECGGQAEFRLELLTDQFAGETTWELSVGGSVVATGGPYTNANTLEIETLCIDANSDVDFEIFDSFGDGICCGFGNGTYEIFLNGTSQGASPSGGAYGAGESFPTFNSGPPNPEPPVCGLGPDVATFTCDFLGDNTVILVGTDESGNTASCSTVVTVSDVTDPSINCSTPVIDQTDPDLCTATVTVPIPSVTDNCGIVSFMNDWNGTTNASDTNYPPGTNFIVWSAIDVNGNSSTCTQVVQVFDNQNPVLNCPSPLIFGTDPDACGAELIIPSPTASDNCGIQPLSLINNQTFTDDASGFYPVGTTVVTWVVRDITNNGATCDVNIVVGDNTPPVAACRDITVELDADGGATISLSDVEDGSSDNCGLAGFNLDPSTFDCNDIGTAVATLTVFDMGGASSTCTSSVTLLDVTAPTAVCQDLTVFLDATGGASIDASDIDGGTSDNCDFTLWADPMTFTCDELDDNAVTLYVEDQGGNTDECVANVVVIDNLAPNAVCQAVTVFLDNDGGASIDASDIDGGTTDNCDFTLSADPNAFDCDNLGVNVAVLFAEDEGGNSASCTVAVTVIDNIPPTLTCPDVSACNFDDLDGIVFFPDPEISDNCPGAFIVSVTPPSGSSFPIGATPVTAIGEDASGNTASCVFDVIFRPTRVSITPSDYNGFGVSCNGGNDGFAEAIATGGFPGATGYMYDWSDGQTTQTAINLTAGFYSVIVSDELGCTVFGSVFLTEPPVLECDVDVTDISCAGEVDGEATASASGGVEPYSYDWSNGATGATVTGLAAGNYDVTITDDNGCESVCNFTIVEPDAIDLSITPIITPGIDGGVSPFGAITASFEVCGGSGAYDLDWFTMGYVRTAAVPSTNAEGEPCITIIVKYEGDAFWEVTITDINDCGGANAVYSNDSFDFMSILDYEVSPASDCETADGTLSILVTNGTPPYSYAWTGPTCDIVAPCPDSDSLTGLYSGWYQVEVTDATGQVARSEYWVSCTRPGRGKTDALGAAKLSAYPNPFSQQTSIEFTVVEDGLATVAIYAVDGKQVAEVFNEAATAGEVYSVPFNADNMANGIYLIRLTTESGDVQLERLILNK